MTVECPFTLIACPISIAGIVAPLSLANTTMALVENPVTDTNLSLSLTTIGRKSQQWLACRSVQACQSKMSAGRAGGQESIIASGNAREMSANLVVRGMGFNHAGLTAQTPPTAAACSLHDHSTDRAWDDL
jgi:hypothetical protein